MIEMKMRTADTRLLRFSKGRKEAGKATTPGLNRSPARRRRQARGVVDETFAALPIRKHTRIQQLIAQTKYGE